VADRRPVRTIARTAGITVLAVFLLSGAVAAGLPGVLLALGMAVVLVGLGALAVGRARWARIGSRRAAAAVAVTGLAVVVAAGATLPDRPRPAAAGPSSALASPAAVETAEASATVRRAATAAPGSALAALAGVPVKGRAPMTGYSRAQFGAGWVDTDRNGCDTRDDVLRRDLTGTAVKAGTHGCVVLSGTLTDPYSGRAIAFRRGVATSTAVQIDHVVALGDAWQTGAQAWDTATRTAFANDPRELLAVDGPLNEQKGDGDAATWLPPDKAYRCSYVARQVAVKVAYGLWMTQAEKDASATVLATCPGQPLPDGVTTPGSAPSTAAPAPTTAAPAAPAAPVATVHPGAYCSPEGATGVTSGGTPMVCRTSATDTRDRWRSAG
jgi:hypothetical protein